MRPKHLEGGNLAKSRKDSQRKHSVPSLATTFRRTKRRWLLASWNVQNRTNDALLGLARTYFGVERKGWRLLPMQAETQRHSSSPASHPHTPQHRGQAPPNFQMRRMLRIHSLTADVSCPVTHMTPVIHSSVPAPDMAPLLAVDGGSCKSRNDTNPHDGSSLRLSHALLRLSRCLNFRVGRWRLPLDAKVTT